MRSIGIWEITLIVIILVAIIVVARIKRQPGPSKQGDEPGIVKADAPARLLLRRWGITALLLALAGLLIYYFFFLNP